MITKRNMRAVKAAQRQAWIRRISGSVQQAIADLIGIIAILIVILATYLLWTTSR